MTAEKHLRKVAWGDAPQHLEAARIGDARLCDADSVSARHTVSGACRSRRSYRNP